MKRRGFAVSLVSVLLLAVTQTPAQKTARTQDAARHSSAAAKTFTEIMNVRDKAIPQELLDNAEAIAVFPGVIKAAFIIGGRGGQGVISRRVKGGWSAPAFFNLGGLRNFAFGDVDDVKQRLEREKLITAQRAILFRRQRQLAILRCELDAQRPCVREQAREVAVEEPRRGRARQHLVQEVVGDAERGAVALAAGGRGAERDGRRRRRAERGDRRRTRLLHAHGRLAVELDPDAAFKKAKRVIKQRMNSQRLSGISLETRACVAAPEGISGGIVVYATHQAPHNLRGDLAGVLGMDANLIRVVNPDMGGGFGVKFGCYPEDVVLAELTRKLKKPLKWVETRVEHLLALRAGQDRALERHGRGYAAFKVWPARLADTRLKDLAPEGPPEQVARAYLREVAIARLALENVTDGGGDAVRVVGPVWRSRVPDVQRGGDDDVAPVHEAPRVGDAGLDLAAVAVAAAAAALPALVLQRRPTSEALAAD